MKRHCIVLAGLGFAAGGFVPIQAEERNAWPLIAQQVDVSGSITSTAALGPLYFQKVKEILSEASLTIPTDEPFQKGGKDGIHSEFHGHLLAELQWMQRAYPGAEW